MPRSVKSPTGPKAHSLPEIVCPAIAGDIGVSPSTVGPAFCERTKTARTLNRKAPSDKLSLSCIHVLHGVISGL